MPIYNPLPFDIYEEGVLVKSRTKLNFVGDEVTAEDDEDNARVNVTIASGVPDDHAELHEDDGADEIDVGGLAGLLADDQHVLDDEVLAAAVQAGAITNAVTKAPTHDAVFDVKATADAAQPAATDAAAAVTAMGAKADDNPLHHDRYTLEAHKVSHQDEGTDEISIAGLEGVSESLASTILQMIDGPLSPMILTGGVVTEGTVGTVSVSELTALLRSDTGATDPLTYVTLAAQANKAIGSADTKYYIVLTDTPAIVVRTTKANDTTEIGLGICMKDTSDPVKVHYQSSGMRLQNGVAKLHKRAASLRVNELASGCAIADVGGDSRQFTVDKGVVYHGINRLTPFADVPYNPFNSNDDKFTYIYGDTDNGFTFSDGTDTVINNTQYYDGAGSLATVGVTLYACHWVYIHSDDNDVYVMYGETNAKLAAAEQAQPPADLPIELAEFGLLLGCIIIKRDATSFAVIQMVSDTFFTGTAVADHGELSGLTEDDHPQYVLVTDLEDTPTEDEANKATTSEYIFDHNADGSAHQSNVGAIGIIIDGGGVAVSTGIKGSLYIPAAYTITAVTLLAAPAGAIVIDIWKQAYADYPPENAQSITASAPPTITATADKSQDTTLSGWTTAIAAGDTLRFNVDSVDTIERCTLILTVTKT